MITIKDLVRETGFGLGTVSRALNGHPGVRPATRALILEAAGRLGFAANPAAQDLAGRRGRPLAASVLVPHLTQPFYAELVNAVAGRLRERGSARARWRLLLHAVFDDDDKAAELEALAAEGRERKLLLVSTAVPDHLVARLSGPDWRCVLVDVQHAELPWVAVDNHAGGRLAATHLASLGHRRVAMLGDAYRSAQALAREEGFREGCFAAGIPDAGLVFEQAHIEDAAIDAALGRLLDAANPPTALFFYSDLMAYRALAWLDRHPGRPRPSLLGYDDLPASAALGLSTVAQPLRELGTRAVDLLVAPRLPAKTRSALLAPVLVPRATTRRPPTP